MTHASPPPPRARIWTWTPWLALLGLGVGIHGFMSAPPPEVHVVTLPTPPTIVTVDPEHQGTQASPVPSEEGAHHDECDHRRDRRSRRRRRHRVSPDPSEVGGLQASCHLDGSWTCIIDRNELLSKLDDPASMAHQARIVPSKKDGQIVGFKLYGIRTGSLPDALHLKNGDLIVSIDDVPLTDLPMIVERVSDLKAEIERGPLSIDYKLVRKGVELTQTLRIE